MNVYASLQDAHAEGFSLGNKGAEKSHGDKYISPPLVMDEDDGTEAVENKCVVGRVDSPHFNMLVILIVTP